ncbi:hypothetical protein T484DRAFT_1749448 [Baffinella frigidus]|nr:hypothetical protein T484DRAFT_1749448 [Cryptophyta sp. CCMP2293]
MCQQESVETVKELMAHLWREKNGLVQRLNAINERIESESKLVAKVRLKAEWMEEKERSVELLNKMTAAPQGVLDEADDLVGELTPPVGNPSFPPFSDTNGANTPPRHPWAFSQARSGLRASWKEHGWTLYRLQTELYTTTMAQISGGFVRQATPCASSACLITDDSAETPAAPASKITRRTKKLSLGAPQLLTPVRKSWLRMWNPSRVKCGDADCSG